MKELDEYLEKRGAKYFVTLTVFCYVIGTVIFNIYLNSIQIAEFNLLKLRYMFVGIMFCFITGVLPLLFFVIKKIFKKSNHEEGSTPKKKTKKQLEKQKKKKILLEIIIIAVFIPWTIFYSTNVFPEIPAAFGGAKPEIVRLIGDPETIQELNELIAFETGIEVDTLPFELATEKSTLAIGANVKILDRNKDRYVLILTKDLYLSSTSNVAKELLESGEIESFESSFSEDLFQAKPIYFSSENIRGTTTTLFEPSEITTSDDLRIAAQVVANNPEKAKAIETVIAVDLPESAHKIVKAVQKKAEEAKEENIETNGSSVVEESDIQEILNETIDPVFLAFRARNFNMAQNLYEKEKNGIRPVNGRKELVESIVESFKADFQNEWKLFSGAENYLIVGQGENDFSLVLRDIFRGANSAQVVIERLNALQIKKVDDFSPVFDSAKTLFKNSSRRNNKDDRKFMSQVLSRHFNKKARIYTEYWSDPKYLYSGVRDEDYFLNLSDFFQKADSWEKVKQLLTEYQSALDLKAIPEDPIEIENSETEEPSEEENPVLEVPEENPAETEETENSGTEEPSGEENPLSGGSEENPIEETENSETEEPSGEENPLLGGSEENPIEETENSGTEESSGEENPVSGGSEENQTEETENSGTEEPSGEENQTEGTESSGEENETTVLIGE